MVKHALKLALAKQKKTQHHHKMLLMFGWAPSLVQYSVSTPNILTSIVRQLNGLCVHDTSFPFSCPMPFAPGDADCPLLFARAAPLHGRSGWGQGHEGMTSLRNRSPSPHERPHSMADLVGTVRAHGARQPCMWRWRQQVQKRWQAYICVISCRDDSGPS